MKAILVNSSDDVDRRVLLAERDAARRDRMVTDLRADLAKTERKLLLAELEAAEYLRQIGRLEDQIGVLLTSASWRWSAPVRRVADLVGRFRALVKGVPAVPSGPMLPGLPPPKEAGEALPPLSLREQAILHRLHRVD